MSTYIISDVHGHLKKFKCMLNIIDFDAGCDCMIILGDVIDRGEENLELLKYIGNIISVHPGTIEILKGNHELFCEMFLKQQLSARKWQLFGGSETLEEVKKLSRQEQKELLKYLEALPHYKKITTKYGSTILTHSGPVIEHIVENADGTINVKASIENSYHR